jgi:hypothetical protein
MHSTQFHKPILLLAWNRPHHLRLVLGSLRNVSPSSLYVSCDGPRSNYPDDIEKVSTVHSIIAHEIDWPCSVKTLYSQNNLGCKNAVSSAISWFFSNVSEGIILEDDCVPSADFYRYCAELLELYRGDLRVWCISGNNFTTVDRNSPASYYFAQIPMCWGWATWSNRWQQYESHLSSWPNMSSDFLLRDSFPNKRVFSYWSQKWNRLYLEGKPDSWAYRWAYTCVVNSGLTAIPYVNLVENVGIGDDSTHTRFGKHRASQLFYEETLSHPRYVLRNIRADLTIYNNHFGGSRRKVLARFPMLALKIRKILHILASLFTR